MAKKKEIVPGPKSETRAEISLLPQLGSKLMYVMIFGVSACLYFNTLVNEYALDDGIVITDNKFTMSGFSGIADIFSHDTFAPVQGVSGELSGGRYRPLSVATFAMEVGLFGKNPLVSHLLNLLFYSGVCLLFLFILHTYFFRGNPGAAFLAALVFTVHPIHTEVIANIKGRDELLAVLFCLLSLIFFFKFSEKRNFLFLGISLIAYFISLFSKETGITFVAVVPLAAYFFTDKKSREVFLSALPFVLVLVIYFYLRFAIVGFATGKNTEVMNAPFILASEGEALATKIMILGKYLLLLIFPHPLSYDYSHPQIPYVGFTDWSFLLSLLVNGFLIFFALKNFKKKNILSFAVLFWFITISIVSNFVFDLGAPMNDRFLFLPSVSFAIAFAVFAKYLFQKINPILVRSGVMLMLILFSLKTISRNADWKNNDTLFITDAEHSPNSAKANVHCAVSYIKRYEKDSLSAEKNFALALPKLRKALELYPDYVDARINLGYILAVQGKLTEAKEVLLTAKKKYPGNEPLKKNLNYVAQKFGERAIQNFREKNLEEAIKNNFAAVECDPKNATAWYNLGGYYLASGDTEKAKKAWQIALDIEPGNAEIKMWLDRISK